ncbi:MAG: OmpH family outer membrane protein [Bacteroidales bacterium]|nr:OmpH family outer membrane protein [Bacteroidales bacterium]
MENTEENINQMKQESPTNPMSDKSCCHAPHDIHKAHVCGFISYGVLVIAVILLYIFHFAGVGTHSRVNPDAKEAVIPENGVIKIAYVNTDSINLRYDYVKDLEKELIAFKNAKENSLKQQMTQFQNDALSLQNEYQNYLKTGDQLTLSQQQAKEAEFKQREAELNQRTQKLSGLEQEYAAQIQERQITENEKMIKAVYAFIREYNAANQQFDLILAKSNLSSPVLYGNEGMDITDEIIAGLNEEYKTVKSNRKK